MAYGVTLASVTEQAVDCYRRFPRSAIKTSRRAYCSHMLSLPFDPDPLAQTVTQVLDGGQMLAPWLTHRFRPPKVHPASEVDLLFIQLQARFENCVRNRGPYCMDDWIEPQLKGLLSLLEHAVAGNEAIVTLLDPPGAKGFLTLTE